jgi:polygalacturonase
MSNIKILGDVAMTIGSNWQISENVLVRNLTIGTSHGLALGSYTYGGIRNVTFDNIVIHGSDPLDTGPNILSQKGRGGKSFC